jgi:Brp/Blh family beta-carotene 15,15'-monooxygenase
MINLSTHRRAAAINDQRRSTRNAQSGLIRAVLAPSWSITALVAAAFVAGISLPPRAVYVPFVASVLLFGLPHGAADHVVIPRVLGQRPRLVSVLIICVGYLALAGAYLAFWFWAPAPAFAMFILMMWWHWGQGDLYALLGFIGAGHLRTHSQRGAALAIRGGLPMLVPLLAFPAVYQAGAHDMIGLFSPHAAAHGAWLWANPFRLTVGNVFVVLMVGTLLLGYRGQELANARHG